MCARADANRNHGLTPVNLHICVCPYYNIMRMARAEEGKSRGVDLGNRTR